MTTKLEPQQIDRMSKLTVVIPALNEEEAIASIIERTHDAIPAIIENTFLDGVNIVVVSDGSSDQTAPIARRYLDKIQLVHYPVNKGYGAAIKIGWSQTNDEYVGFLDADGTCNPLFFIDLCKEMEAKGSDILLGSRLNENSEMPLTRRVGNTIFANLINFWAGTNIKDSASGMRLIKRASLKKIFPLPDGLHFTPAMSAKALFNKEIKINEIPMPYKERVGESKLSVVKDGWRFLKVIIENAIQYRPRRLFNIIGAILSVFAVFYAIEPLKLIFEGTINHNLYLYRYIAIFTVLNSAIFLMGVGFISQNFIDLMIYKKYLNYSSLPLFNYIYIKRGMITGFVFLLIAAGLLFSPFVEYIRLGAMPSFSWTRILLGSFILMSSVQFIGFGVIGVVLNLIKTNLTYAETAVEEYEYK